MSKSDEGSNLYLRNQIEFSSAPQGVYFINVVFPETPAFKETAFVSKWEGWLSAKRSVGGGEPLSSIEVAALAREAFGNPIPKAAYKLAHAIEQAHGIN